MLQERWKGWTAAERSIVVGVALFALVVALVFGVLSPIQTAKQNAMRAHTQITQDVGLVENGIANLRARSAVSVGAATDVDRFRAQVTQMAQTRGLSVVRLQNGAQGSVQLYFADAAPGAIYQWLEDISTLPGSRVISGNLLGRDEGVQAEIELQGAQP